MNPPVIILVPLLALSLAAVLLVLYLLYRSYRDFKQNFDDFLEFHASLTGSLDDPCLDALRRLTGEGSEPEKQNSPEPENS
jgi:Flp pilus assembly protein TadB